MASVGRAQGSRHADPRSGRAQRLRAALSKVLPSPAARPLTCAGQGDMANNIGPRAPTEPSPDSRAQIRTHTNQHEIANQHEPVRSGRVPSIFHWFSNVFWAWELGPLYHRAGNTRTHGWDHINARVTAGAACMGCSRCVAQRSVRGYFLNTCEWWRARLRRLGLAVGGMHYLEGVGGIRLASGSAKN